MSATDAIELPSMSSVGSPAAVSSSEAAGLTSSVTVYAPDSAGSTATSPAPGTVAVDQLAAFDHAPPAALLHVTVAAPADDAMALERRAPSKSVVSDGR